jgi:hypothetical protein
MAAAARTLGFSSSHFKRVIDSTNLATIARLKEKAQEYKTKLAEDTKQNA